MAGMDWFRWHHGSVTDPKFQLVARKSGGSLTDVLAIWAFLLEKASAATDRGCFGEVDAEALDVLFNFPSTETRTANILRVLEERGLTDGGRIARWEDRQPKREREGDSSTSRVQAFRAKQHQATQGNATKRHETPREEEKRVDEKDTPQTPRGGLDGRFERFWEAYPRKQGKDGAKRAFEKRKPDEALLATMLAAVEAQKRTEQWTRDGGQFIPFPATWINQGRWQDAVGDNGAPPVEWHETQAGVDGRAKELGILLQQATEQFSVYKARVMAAHKQGAH